MVTKYGASGRFWPKEYVKLKLTVGAPSRTSRSLPRTETRKTGNRCGRAQRAAGGLLRGRRGCTLGVDDEGSATRRYLGTSQTSFAGRLRTARATGDDAWRCRERQTRRRGPRKREPACRVAPAGLVSGEIAAVRHLERSLACRSARTSEDAHFQEGYSRRGTIVEQARSFYDAAPCTERIPPSLSYWIPPPASTRAASPWTTLARRSPMPQVHDQVLRRPPVRCGCPRETP